VAKGPVFYIEDVPIFLLSRPPGPGQPGETERFPSAHGRYSNQYGPEAKTAFYCGHLQGNGFYLFLQYWETGDLKKASNIVCLPRETTGQAKILFHG